MPHQFMQHQLIPNRRISITLLLIIGIGILISQGFIETSFYVKANAIVKYSIYFIWLVVVGFIGHWGWKSSTQKWISTIWIYTYAFVLIVLLILGLVDMYLLPISTYIKKDISHFRAFFLSPIYFIILYLLSKLDR